jgi:hypothetical protein
LGSHVELEPQPPGLGASGDKSGWPGLG